MLCQQESDVRGAHTLFTAPVLHGAQRDARLLCKSGLRQASAGHQLSHRKMRERPDAGQPFFLAVQIYAPVGIVRDAEGDIVEERCPGCFRVGCHNKEFSSSIHSFLLLKSPRSMFAHRLGTFSLLHIFQSFKILRVKVFHYGLSLNVVQIAVHECLALFIGEFDAGSDHQVASVQMRGLDVAIIGEVRVDHPNAVAVLDFCAGGHNLGCKLVSSKLFHNCCLHVFVRGLSLSLLYTHCVQLSRLF
nr:MAG TPA: hypothetical protein [Caudoviricetes sp.]